MNAYQADLSAMHILLIFALISVCLMVFQLSLPQNPQTMQHTTIRIGASCDMMSVVQLQITIKS